MAINEIQTNVNNSTAYSINQNNGVTSNATATTEIKSEETVSKNTDTFTFTGTEETAGIYSPNETSVNGTNANNPTISGTNSFISQKKREYAQQAGITLDSNLNPIVNNDKDGVKAAKYYQLLCATKNSTGYNAGYVVSQNDSGKAWSGNCMRTSLHMMARMNSNGQAEVAVDSNGNAYVKNGTKNTYYTNADKSAYSPDKTGYNRYTGLTREELSNIIVSELDNGRVVQLHTRYSGNEHWVVVTGYTLNGSGEISLTTENGKEYITGLAGVDPFKGTDPKRPQYTTNLGKNASVNVNGQWLETVNGGYEVRTYKP